MKRTHAKPIRRTLLLIPILLALALAGCAVGTAPVDATTATAGETGEIAGTVAQAPPETTLEPLAADAENHVSPTLHPPVKNPPEAIVSPPEATV